MCPATSERVLLAAAVAAAVAGRCPGRRCGAICDTGVHVAETPWVESFGRSCSAGNAGNAITSPYGWSRGDRCL